MTEQSNTPVAEKKGLIKFVPANDSFAVAYGFKNRAGLYVSREYLSRYVQCWCRLEDGFIDPAPAATPPVTRKSLFAYFMSDEQLLAHKGMEASAYGKLCSTDALWGDNPRKVAAALKVKQVVEPTAPAEPAAPAAQVTDNPEAAAFAAETEAIKEAVEAKVEAAIAKATNAPETLPSATESRKARREKLNAEAQRIMTPA